MKKLLTIVILALVSMSVFAGPKDKFHYLVTDKGTIYCSDIKLGLFSIKLILPNGEKMTVATENALAYYNDGRVYERKPAVVDGKVTNQKAWMELIKTRYNLRVYKIVKYDAESGNMVNRYLVFDNQGGFKVEINSKNKSHLLPFLGLKES
jgi:hypothetical protein